MGHPFSHPDRDRMLCLPSSTSTKSYSKQPVCLWGFWIVFHTKTQKTHSCLNVSVLILSLLVMPSSWNHIFYCNTSLLLSPYLKLWLLTVRIAFETLKLEAIDIPILGANPSAFQQTFLLFWSESSLLRLSEFHKIFTVPAVSLGVGGRPPWNCVQETPESKWGSLAYFSASGS